MHVLCPLTDGSTAKELHSRGVQYVRRDSAVYTNENWPTLVLISRKRVARRAAELSVAIRSALTMYNTMPQCYRREGDCLSYEQWRPECC